MPAESTPSQSDEIQRLIIEAARTQVAAMSAVTKFWVGWAESADKYTQAIGDELQKIAEAGATSSDAIGRVADLTREYLRNLADLPNQAMTQFSTEIGKLGKPAAKRARSAKAKD